MSATEGEHRISPSLALRKSKTMSIHAVFVSYYCFITCYIYKPCNKIIVIWNTKLLHWDLYAFAGGSMLAWLITQGFADQIPPVLCVQNQEENTGAQLHVTEPVPSRV